MMDVYNGNVTTQLSAVSSLTVNLPDYFEALNGDFRYQLTVIGQFAQAFVRGPGSVANGRFTIKTGRPKVEKSPGRSPAYATTLMPTRTAFR
jgi:trimeric autotransporter adhesin